MLKRPVALLMFLIAMLFFVSSCSPSAASSTPASTTALDGATLVQERCSRCHPLTRVESSSHTSAEWKTIVDQMIARGAQLTPDEETLVVSYLATNFGK